MLFFAVWGKDEDSKGWRNCQVESKIGLVNKNDKRIKDNKKNRKKSELGIFTDDPEGR